MVLNFHITQDKNVISMATHICCPSSLSLFHSFTKQTLLNTYCASGIFINAENTVVIQMKIVPTLTELRVYDLEIQNSE